MKTFLLLFALAIFVNSTAQELEGFVPVSKRKGERIRYDDWCGFKIISEAAIWQKIYDCKGMGQDSIRSIVLAWTKSDIRLTLINDSKDELAFDVVDKEIKKEFIYKAKLLVEVKPEKYRITLKSMDMKGPDPQSFVEGNGKFFRDASLNNLAALNFVFSDAFDFRKPVKAVSKDW